MFTAPRGWRRVFRAAVATSAAVLLLGALTPASASPADAEAEYQVPAQIDGMPVEEYIDKYDHPLGSQVRRVEGDESTPETVQAAETNPTTNAAGEEVLAGVEGIDVSGHQGNVDWRHWWNQGKRFTYVKATEGTGYRNPYHLQQYNGSYKVGMIRGSYHFALPDQSSGAAQANFFVDHGGGWSADGKTLPGALDIEYNPYGDRCYGKSQAAMGAWIRDFHDTYHARTGRWPVIYTTTAWWNQCVGKAENFGSTVPLWLARYDSSIGPLPHGWGFHTFWQYTASPIDYNRFNGSADRLRVLAKG